MKKSKQRKLFVRGLMVIALAVFARLLSQTIGSSDNGNRKAMAASIGASIVATSPVATVTTTPIPSPIIYLSSTQATGVADFNPSLDQTEFWYYDNNSKLACYMNYYLNASISNGTITEEIKDLKTGEVIKNGTRTKTGFTGGYYSSKHTITYGGNDGQRDYSITITTTVNGDVIDQVVKEFKLIQPMTAQLTSKDTQYVKTGESKVLSVDVDGGKSKAAYKYEWHRELSGTDSVVGTGATLSVIASSENNNAKYYCVVTDGIGKVKTGYVSVKEILTVTFDLGYSENGSLLTDSKVVNYGEALGVSPIVPSRSGFKFVSWLYTGDQGSTTYTEYYPGGSIESVTRNMTLVAQWKPDAGIANQRITLGKTKTPQPKSNPYNGSVSYESANTNIIKVIDGQLKAVGYGTAKVTAVISGDETQHVEDSDPITFKVTVVPPKVKGLKIKKGRLVWNKVSAGKNRAKKIKYYVYFLDTKKKCTTNSYKLKGDKSLYKSFVVQAFYGKVLGPKSKKLKVKK